jgi:16S rRNA processing protein RimM
VADGPPDALLAGEVGKPHGLEGEVYVMPISDDPARFDPGSALIHQRAGPVVVAASRRHRNRLLVRFEGVTTRERAEALRGGALYVAADRLRELEAGEFWQHEVTGCRVVDRAGNAVGKVIRVIPGAAQDLLEVATERGGRLVPVVSAIVVRVDVEARLVVIDPPPGLLD